MLGYSIAAIAASCIITQASLDLSFGNDRDLTSFVTRPAFKMPKFRVEIYDENRIAPGYWFLAPYAMIFQEKHASKYYQPCQTGPSIYDSRGDLVWSGACEVKNQNTCDFRAWQFSNGSVFTSAILTPFRDVDDVTGHGIIMDDTYRTIGNIRLPTTERNFNMHELNLVDDGRRAIHIIHKSLQVDLSMFEPDLTAGWVLDMGFREIDMETGKVTFEWWAARDGHVDVTESRVPFRHGRIATKPWNWFHGNAVEKNAEGDYMLSSRFTDTIYKISGKDGSILWRLGGSKSSFTQDFTFARQHDPRWQSRSSDGKKDVISFLDNGSDDAMQIRNTSIARVVELDFSSSQWTARAVKEIPRPDKRLTRMRGNHQILDNGNSFICWSENAVISEHSPEGNLLMEARFLSHRFVTYRAYKFNFTSVPIEPITVSATAYGSTSDTSTTVIHVSWNGATEVSFWRFKDASGNILGEKLKTGFETAFQAEGYISEVFVEAVAQNASTIGTSPRSTVKRPEHWEIDSSPPQYHHTEPAEHEGSPVIVAETQPPRAATQFMLLSNEGLAFGLFATTVIMICVALWLWRCTDGGRSSIRLGADRTVPSTIHDKAASLG